MDLKNERDGEGWKKIEIWREGDQLRSDIEGHEVVTTPIIVFWPPSL